ncbi:MAG: isopentenyl phosphate kinase [Candidatus Bathyarchaeota archaeon]|nr:isopentenyl phosphate kinase [Candidatus Bathyarchaeota archaeon]MCX8178054.1 isopentenyl phosphate kinase [Candidatus Bathyarchaeota archaeon]MDW8194323.1 isopentenyl phosphate kinase [Nitrososphaerota archaeon]
MSKAKPVILKIGGSVLTNKTVELEARMDMISGIADQILEANPKNLVIVHGGGSFGHPTAQKYAIKEGFKDEAQIAGFAETHHIMTVLNGLLMDALIWRGIPAISMAPSSYVITRNGRIQHLDMTILKRLLEMGFIPVLYGDTVIDEEIGFTILSGDQIVAYLATQMNAERILVGVDVDGVYDDNPKSNPKAKMFTRLNMEELKNVLEKLGGSEGYDVTGGMRSKIAELMPAVMQGIPVLIFNATKTKHIYKAIKGENVKGTLIEKE